MNSAGLLALYVAACFGAGHLLTRVIRFRADAGATAPAALVQVAAAFLLGVGLLAAGWTVAAVFGALSWPLVLSAIVMFALVGGLTGTALLADAALDIQSAFATLRREPWTVQTAAALTVVLAAINGIPCLVPPAPWTDPASFYLAIAQTIAASGRLAPLPGYYENFSVVGMMGELHYAAILTLGRDTTAKALVFPVALASAVALFGIAERAGLGLRGQVFLAAALFTSSAFTLLIGDGKVDLFGTCLGLCAVLLVLYRPIGAPVLGQGGAYLALTGLAAGFAVIGKLTFLAALAPPLALLIVWQELAADGPTSGSHAPASARMTQAIKALMVVGAFALIAALPHMLKNAVLFQAPLAPLYDPLDRIARYQGGGAILRDAGTLWRVLALYPLYLSYGRIPLQYGTMSPLLFAFAPLAAASCVALCGAKYSRLLQVTVCALLGVALYTAIQPAGFMPRYFLVPAVLLLVPAAWAGERWWSPSRTAGTRAAVATAVIVILLFGIISVVRLYTQWWAFPPIWPYLSGRIDACEYAGEACAAAESVNAAAARGDRVYNFAYASSYWLRPDLLSCGMRRAEIVHDDTFNIDLAGNEPKWRFLAEQGFRFVFVDACSGGYPWRPSDFPHPDSAPEWLGVTTLHSGGCFRALRLTPREGAPRATRSCIARPGGGWDLSRP